MTERTSTIFQLIDPKIASAIDAYSLHQLWEGSDADETDRYQNFRYGIIQNGIDAVAHAAIFKILAERRKTSAPLRTVIEEMEISFDNEELTMPFSSVEREGLYIPPARKELKTEIDQRRKSKSTNPDEQSLVTFFDSHFHDWVKHASWIDEDYGVTVHYPFELIHRLWRPYDLENPKLIELGKRFAHEWWQKSEKALESRCKHPQDQILMNLGMQLRDYYQEIMKSCD